MLDTYILDMIIENPKLKVFLNRLPKNKKLFKQNQSTFEECLSIDDSLKSIELRNYLMVSKI